MLENCSVREQPVNREPFLGRLLSGRECRGGALRKLGLQPRTNFFVPPCCMLFEAFGAEVHAGSISFPKRTDEGVGVWAFQRNPALLNLSLGQTDFGRELIAWNVVGRLSHEPWCLPSDRLAGVSDEGF